MIKEGFIPVEVFEEILSNWLGVSVVLENIIQDEMSEGYTVIVGVPEDYPHTEELFN